MRKDIYNLDIILTAIEAAEAKAEASSVQSAANLSALYTCLKGQCRLVIQEQALEELSETKIN